MKLIQLVNSFDAFMRFSSIELPIELSYSYKKLVKKILEERAFYEKFKQELLQKYAVLNKDRTEYIFENEETKNLWEVEFNKLLNVEIVLDFEPILLKVLKSNKIKVSTLDLVLLDWLIISEEEKYAREEPKTE